MRVWLYEHGERERGEVMGKRRERGRGEGKGGERESRYHLLVVKKDSDLFPLSRVILGRVPPPPPLPLHPHPSPELFHESQAKQKNNFEKLRNSKRWFLTMEGVESHSETRYLFTLVWLQCLHSAPVLGKNSFETSQLQGRMRPLSSPIVPW